MDNIFYQVWNLIIFPLNNVVAVGGGIVYLLILIGTYLTLLLNL